MAYNQSTVSRAFVDTTNPTYELVSEIGSGNFGITKLMRNRNTNELVAVKFIERGEKIDTKVQRELINHRMLLHPHVIVFNEVFLTPTHLGIAMEYASAGELYSWIAKKGRVTEDIARYFFQQLISGVAYFHSVGVCHRDLKLQNIVLENGPDNAPRLKICDFGYSKSSVFDSLPKSRVGTFAYIAPEVLSTKADQSVAGEEAYDGKAADVWSCGVMLFVMLAGAYPFADPADPKNLTKIMMRILTVNVSFPPDLRLSKECLDLLCKIFTKDPLRRITMDGIRQHPWFLRNLPHELQDCGMAARRHMQPSRQSIEELKNIVAAAQQRVMQRPQPQSSMDMDFSVDEYMGTSIEPPLSLPSIP